MRPEQEFGHKFRQHMKGSGWDVTCHEDTSTYGTPDLSWGARGINGWMELKVIPNLTDSRKPARIKLRKLQRIFLIKRGRTGGHCSVLVWVSRTQECLLFTSEGAFRALETWTPEELYRNADVISKGLPEPSRFLDVLTIQGG